MEHPPVIFIPGFVGTNLANVNRSNFDTLYSALEFNFETFDNLRLDISGFYDRNMEVIIERAGIEDAAYREIIAVLRREGFPVYIFGYDWRLSSRESGKRLKNFVEILHHKLNRPKFNFLTHSMGGLVFECFLKELNNDYSLLNRAVVTVSPFSGMIKSLMAMVVGESGDPLPLFIRNDSFRKILRTFPSMYELSPTYDKALTKDGKNYPLSFDPASWQSNLIRPPDDEDHGIVERRLNGLREFRETRPARLELKDLDEELRKKIVVLAAEGEKTRCWVIVKDTNFNGKVSNFFDFDAEFGEGDGTVPLVSAAAYQNKVLTLVVKSRLLDIAIHALFLNDGRVQNVIRRFLNETRKEYEKPRWWEDVSGTIRKVGNYPA